MSVIIKHEALEPFYLKHDYKGYYLLDSRNKNKVIEGKDQNFHPLIQEIITRKIGELEGTFTPEEFEAKCQEIHQQTISCLKKPSEKEEGTIVNER